MKKPAPLWKSMLRAIRRFNWFVSLPRTAWPMVRLLLGMERLRDERPVLLTFSISEDHARLWYHFAKKAVGDHWQIVIGDSRGDLDPAKFPGARIIRAWNQLYHGAKIDLFLKRVIGRQTVFLCDDDKYLLFDPTPRLTDLEVPKTAVLSVSPRVWYTLTIGGRTYMPMGSHALIFRPDVLAAEGLRLQPPRRAVSTYRTFIEGSKHQVTYDTGDYANEQLLLRGYRILTEQHDSIVGFDGLSGGRLLLAEFGKPYVVEALSTAPHLKEGSANAYVFKAVCAIVAFERAYRDIFKVDPAFVSGFSEDELVAIVKRNPHLQDGERARLEAAIHEAVAVAERLRTNA